MEYIVGSITSLIMFSLGFYLGRATKFAPEVEKIFDTVAKKMDRSPVGVVKRPTQADLDKRKDPLQKRIEEGKDAMRDTLKVIVDNASQDKG